MLRKYIILLPLFLIYTATFSQVDFGEARMFMQKRCNNVNMVYEDGFSMDYDGSILHIFLVSQGSNYCVSTVSQYQLDVMASKCGGYGKRSEFYDMKGSYSIETDWHRREKERMRKVRESQIAQRDARTKNIVLEHLSNGDVDRAIVAYKDFSSTQKKEFKTKISSAFNAKYSSSSKKLESDEVKEIIENNKTVFASLKEGNYKINIDNNGKTEGLPSVIDLNPYSFKINEFECYRPCTFEVLVKSDINGVCLSSEWKNSFDQVTTNWNFYKAEKKGEILIIGGYFKTPPKKYTNVVKIKNFIQYEDCCVEYGNKKGKLLYLKKYSTNGKVIHSVLSKGDDCLTNKWLWKGAFTEAYKN